MIVSLYANKLGLLNRGSEILQKWLWLESRVIDCDSSRVNLWKTWLDSSHFVKNVTRVESESPKIVTRVKSSRVIDLSHAITGTWSMVLRKLGNGWKLKGESWFHYRKVLFVVVVGIAETWFYLA